MTETGIHFCSFSEAEARLRWTVGSGCWALRDRWAAQQAEEGTLPQKGEHSRAHKSGCKRLILSYLSFYAQTILKYKTHY